MDLKTASASGAVGSALDGLLQDIVCLVQAHAITPKELKGALKQLRKQFRAADLLPKGSLGPCAGLPSPIELVSWLLQQNHAMHAAVGPAVPQSSPQHQRNKRKGPTALALAAPANGSLPLQQQQQQQQKEASKRLMPTAAAATLTAGKEHVDSAHRSHISSLISGGRDPEDKVPAAPAAAQPTALVCLHLGPETAEQQHPPRYRRKTKLKQQLMSSSRAVVACRLKNRSIGCCLAVDALDKCSELPGHELHHTAGVPATAAAAAKTAAATATAEAAAAPATAKLAAADLRSSSVKHVVAAGAATEAAATAAAGARQAASSSRPDQWQLQQNMRYPLHGFSAMARVQRYLQLPARSLATGNTPAAAAAGDSTQPAAQHNPAGTAESADTTFKTLKAYLALKKLSLAGLQAKIRAQITAEAPGKQYCHVSLPGAPAGAVRNLAGWGSNLAGNSGNLAGFSGNLAGQLRCAESAESPMLILFRDVAKAQQQAGVIKSHHGTVQRLRNQQILQQHKHEAAEFQRRREEAAAARLSALKNASLPEYLEMVKQAKNGRLQLVLEQTDDCLRKLAKKLGVEDLLEVGDDPFAAAAAAAAAARTNAAAAAGILGSSSAWAKLAGQLYADIPQQPKMLKGGELRDYQMQGVRWLVGLSQKGLNGILADDMGLGKTVQVIAMVCHCVEVQQSPGPFLIVCPASVISNWAAELSCWAPDLLVVQYKGSAEAREEVYHKQIRKKRFHVVLTTYELLMSPADRSRLTRIYWQGMVVDEGHRLKNADCKLAQELRAYKTRNRLLLTGTPLQNKLSELWSLLNFLMPDVFNSADDFDSWFGAPLQAIKAAQDGCAAAAAGSEAEVSLLTQEEYLLVTNRLHQVLRPFMMRRLKESVATELPGKTEVVLRCQLSPYQLALYDLVKSKLRNEAAAGTAGSSNGRSAAAAVKGVNNTVMELRNICNHPVLSKLHPEYGEDLLKDPIQGSGVTGGKLPNVLRMACKVDLLDQVLVRLKAGGHKVLLFCTMTRLLDVLEEYLDWRGFNYLRLDGTTGAQERADAVNKFNNPGSETFLFMLSLRAGGVGLNLQAADTVIMFDSDWNPQIDLQAQARAYRIGQKRKVLVVRLVAEGTIEEHILKVAETKRQFADSSITGGFFDGQTPAEERRQYLLQILDTNPTAAAAAAGGAAAAVRMTAETLNRLLARSDEELCMWQLRDKDLVSGARPQGSIHRLDLDPAAAAAAGSRSNPDLKARSTDPMLCRVATEAESADLIAAAREAAAPAPEEDLSSYGRGMRGARSVSELDNAAAAAAKRQRRAAAATPANSSQTTAAAPLPKRPPGRPRKVTAAAAAGDDAAQFLTAAAAARAASAAGSAAESIAAPFSISTAAAAAAAAALTSTAESPPACAAAAGGAKMPPAELGQTAAAAAVAIAMAAEPEAAAATAAAPVPKRPSGRPRKVAAANAAATDAAQEIAAAVATRAAAAALASTAEPTPERVAAGKPSAELTSTAAAAAAATMLIADAPGAVTAKTPVNRINRTAPAVAPAAAAARTKDETESCPVLRTSADCCDSTTAAAAHKSKEPTVILNSERVEAAPVAVAAAAAGAVYADGHHALRASTTGSIHKRGRPPRTIAAAASAAAAADEPAQKKQKIGTAAPSGTAGTAAAAAAASGGGGSSGNGGSSSGGVGIGGISMSETVAVCCGVVKGWYSIIREEVLLQPDQQQQPVGRTRASSSGTQQQQREMWMSKCAFMMLGGQAHKKDVDRAIKLLSTDGGKGASIGTYIKQYEKWERQQQSKVREGSGTGSAAAAAAGSGGGSSRGKRSSSGANAPAPASTAAAAVTAADDGSKAIGMADTKVTAAAAVWPPKKRGRPSKAETAAKLAAEAAEAFGTSSKAIITSSSTGISTWVEQKSGSLGQKRAAAAAACGDASTEDQPASKKQRSNAAAAAAARSSATQLVVAAAAAFDAMCDIQHLMQQQQQPELAAAAVDSSDVAFHGSVVAVMGIAFDSLWA